MQMMQDGGFYFTCEYEREEERRRGEEEVETLKEKGHILLPGYPQYISHVIWQ